MFQELIISKDLSINKFLNDLKCNFYLTKPQFKNLQTILTDMIINGYNSKISQIIVSLLSCNGLTLPYSVDIYDKQTMSKIELAKSLINGLSKKLNKLIVLADSWYSSKAIFDATVSNENHNYIGAIKTNRVLYPKSHNNLGVRIPMFAKSLPLDSFDQVTVRKKKYYVYKYVGDLNNRKNVAIVLSYPKDSLYENFTFRLSTFFSTEFIRTYFSYTL